MKDILFICAVICEKCGKESELIVRKSNGSVQALLKSERNDLKLEVLSTLDAYEQNKEVTWEMVRSRIEQIFINANKKSTPLVTIYKLYTFNGECADITTDKNKMIEWLDSGDWRGAVTIHCSPEEAEKMSKGNQE